MFHFNWISIDVFLCFQGAQVQSNECGAIYSRFPSQWICTCYAFPCHVSNSLHNSGAIISGASFYYMSSLIILCPWDCTGSFQCSLTLHLRFHPPMYSSTQRYSNLFTPKLKQVFISCKSSLLRPTSADP